MAEPSEGTYIILNVKSKLAIDVKGASDKSGANVQQWTKTGKDSQIWALTKQTNGWEIICSLTGKSLDVASAASGQNVRQWNDTNSTLQRWAVDTDGKTVTYNSVSYPSYIIKAKNNTSLVLDVESGSTSAGANIRLYSSNSSEAQRWILIPAAILNTSGVYEIVLAEDTSMCIDIASGSTANKANAQVYSRNGTNAQKFFADVDDDDTFTTVFRNVASNRVLDISGGTAKNGANIWQYNSNGSTAQKWLPVRNGSVKIDGQTYSTYNIRAQSGTNFVMDCKGGGKTAKTNIQLWTNNGSAAQKFAFVKSDALDTSIPTPPAFTPTSFSRNGSGNVTVEGLTFVGNEPYYQARYFIRYFTAGRSAQKDTAWKNLADDSTSRSGWGDAWNYTIQCGRPNGDNDSKKLAIPFSKTVTLDGNTQRSAELHIEYRLFRPAGDFSNFHINDRITEIGSGKDYPMHGNSRTVVISITQNPVFTAKSFGFVEDSANNMFGVRIAVGDSIGNKCEVFRGRLLGADGNPITEWVSDNSMTLDFYANGALRRIPESNEACTLEYQVLTDERASSSGTLTANFSYGSSSLALNPVIGEIGESCVATVTNPTVNRAYCLVETPDTDGSVVRMCERDSSVTGQMAWKCLPPLNRDAKIIIIGSSNGTGWSRTDLTCRISTHNFIWNWSDEHAIVIINSDAPPAQTRSYTTDAQFNSPLGRINPVGFASTAVQSDLSITGVIVDPDASYESAAPLPEKSTREDILKLVRLAGNGIHPVYRTPYGDWHIVEVESVDVSKTELYLSAVSVKQRAVDE